MDRNLLRAAGAALLLTAVACGGGDAPGETLPVPEPASASAPAGTPPAGPIAGPRPEGEVEVTALRVGTTEAAGTHPAVACGRYFMPAAQQGVVYSFTHQNLSVTVMADDRRVPGLQHEDAVSIFVNGGEEPVVLTKGNGRIHFSDDFRTAEIDAMLSTMGGAASIPFKATFRCHGA